MRISLLFYMLLLFTPQRNLFPVYAVPPAPQVTQAVACVDVTDIPLSECTALLALYKATDGANWLDHSNWTVTTTACNWVGITCAQNHVIGINLNTNRLNGTVPAELGDLSYLVYLQLARNQLSGSIPPQLGILTNLTILWLHENQLSGALPTSLGNLVNLRELILSNNQLNGPLPLQLATLTQLTILRLDHNQFSGEIPAELSALVNLTTLWLHENQLSGAIPAPLSTLGNLRELILGNNQLTGTIPPQLGNLSKLTILRLERNELTGAIPPELGALTALTTLWLHENQLSGAIPPQLGTASNLTQLILGSNQLTGAIPPQLANLHQLAILRLERNQLTGAIPPELGSLSLLTTLWLHENQLSGAIPPQLGAATNLTQLILGSNQLTGTIPPQLGNLANLTILRLERNRLTGAIPPELGVLANLTTLWLHENQLSGELPMQLGALANLTELILSVNQLTGPIPPQLGDLSKLSILRLDQNQLTGALPPALGRLNNLTILWLHKNQLSGVLPSQLGNLTKLKQLILHTNQLTGIIQPTLGNLTNLVLLSLADNHFQGTIPTELGQLTQLSDLNLTTNQLTGTVPSMLGNLSKLMTLGIGLNQLRGEIPDAVACLPALIFADVSYNALTATETTTRTCLDRVDPDWHETQTVAPTLLQTKIFTVTTLQVNWIPISYIADGGFYEIEVAQNGNGPFTVVGNTAKSSNNFLLTGLLVDTTYYFRLRTFTPTHNGPDATSTADDQQNSLWSDYSAVTAGMITSATARDLRFLFMPLVVKQEPPRPKSSLTFTWQRLGMTGQPISALAIYTDRLLMANRSERTQATKGIYQRSLANCDPENVPPLQLWADEPTYALAVENHTILAGTEGRSVLYSSDGGNRWQRTASAIEERIIAVIIADNNFYAAGDTTGVFQSNNGTDGWRSIDDSPLLVNGLGYYNKVLWVATADAGMWRLAPTNDIITQVDSGLVDYTGTKTPALWDVTIDPQSKHLYVATANGVFTSDGTDHWTHFAQAGTRLRSITFYVNRLFAGSADGRLFSWDLSAANTETATEIVTKGPPTVGSIYDLLYDATHCQGLLAATNDGVWLLRLQSSN